MKQLFICTTCGLEAEKPVIHEPRNTEKQNIGLAKNCPGSFQRLEEPIHYRPILCWKCSGELGYYDEHGTPFKFAMVHVCKEPKVISMTADENQKMKSQEQCNSIKFSKEPTTQEPNNSITSEGAVRQYADHPYKEQYVKQKGPVITTDAGTFVLPTAYYVDKKPLIELRKYIEELIANDEKKLKTDSKLLFEFGIINFKVVINKINAMLEKK